MFTKKAAHIHVWNRQSTACVDIHALEYRCWICSILNSYSGDLGFRSSELPYVVFPDVSSFLTYTDYVRVDFLQRRNYPRFWPSILPQREIQKSHSQLQQQQQQQQQQLLLLLLFFLLTLQHLLGVVFYSPLVGFSLLAYEVSWSHTTTRHIR